MSKLNAEHQASETIPKRQLMRLLFGLLALIILLGIFLFRQEILQLPNFSFLNQNQPVSMEELEADYGIRVRLIGVTAAGGLIDVRFKILDVEKAKLLFNDPENSPKLIAENGTLISVSDDDQHEIVLKQDGIVFMLYPNIDAAIKPGTPVTIRFGELEVEPIMAQ